MSLSVSISINRQDACHALVNWWRSMMRDITVLLKAYQLPLAMVALYLAAAFSLSLFGLHSPPVRLLFGVAYAFIAIFIMIIPISWFSAGTALRLANIMLVVCMMVSIKIAALGFKANIPLLNPWAWDLDLAAFDRMLHAGMDPWRLLMPPVGQEITLKILDMAYSLWFPLLLISWFLVGVVRHHDNLKTQYVLAFLLAWVIGGNLLATMFSSVGPVFVGNLHPDAGNYSELLRRLAHADALYGLTATELHSILWRQYEAGMNIFGGISAFPSMHNALAVLMALVAWRIHRLLGIAMTIFAAMIYIGSILLAWHYAADGMAGIVIALASWHMAGWITRRLDRKPQARRYRALLRAVANR